MILLLVLLVLLILASGGATYRYRDSPYVSNGGSVLVLVLFAVLLFLLLQWPAHYLP